MAVSGGETRVLHEVGGRQEEGGSVVPNDRRI